MNGELPEGWARATLGDLIDGFEAGRNLRAAGAPAGPKQFGVLKISAVTWGSFRPQENKALLPGDTPRTHEVVRKGDLLISRANTSDLVGAVVLVGDDHPNLMLPDKILRLLPKKERVDSAYLVHALRSQEVREHFAFNATGTSDSMRNLSQPKMASAPIMLPPLCEQRRIVEKVEALLADVNAARERLAKVPLILKRFRQAVLAAACSGRLTEEWRTGECEEPDARMPARWRELPLRDLASSEPRAIQSGPFGSNLHHAEFQTTGRLVIGIDNVGEGRFLAGRQHRISEAKFRELERYRARPLDVLITVMASVGRCCLVPEDIEPAIITKHVYRITVDRNTIVPAFLLHVLRGSPDVRESVQGQIRGQTRPGINGEILKGLPVPVPPLEEQAEIVRRVESLFAVADAIEERVKLATACADKLPQAILSKAFRGELVPTEAELARAEGRGYETAEKMLPRAKDPASELPRTKGRRKAVTA